MTIRAFHKRERQFRQIMSASHGLSRGRYLRLMSLSGVEIIGTIPLATYFIVSNAKSGIHPWTNWADVHAHYNAIAQIAGFIWKNDETIAVGIEIYRWSLVVCAFIFFGFFGFAEEAVQHYRRVYTTIASRIGYSSFTLRGSSHGWVVYSLYVSDSSSLNFFFFFLQYFLSCKEQGRRHRFCCHNERRQAQIERLVRRPAHHSGHFPPQ
jgi:hypothetical protein